MKQMYAYFLDCKGQSNDDVGVARGTMLHKLRPGAGLKPAIWLKKRWKGDRRKRLPARLR